jgi:hypothetical protein
MRPLLLCSLLLALAACSRSHAPPSASSPGAKPADIAQAVPAGTGPAPAPAASIDAAAPVAVDAATGKPEPPPDKSDPRWKDVDPNTLGGRSEEEMAKFLAEQRKRDAELMARDAAEAKSRVAAGPLPAEGDERRADARDDRRYVDERYADERYADERYAEDRYAEDRYAEDRYAEDRYADPREDGRYDPREDERYDPRDEPRDYEDSAYGVDPQDEAPWDEGAYDEPPPYEDEDYPPPDEDYDPRYDPGYGRR